MLYELSCKKILEFFLGVKLMEKHQKMYKVVLEHRELEIGHTAGRGSKLQTPKTQITVCYGLIFTFL